VNPAEGGEFDVVDVAPWPCMVISSALLIALIDSAVGRLGWVVRGHHRQWTASPSPPGVTGVRRASLLGDIWPDRVGRAPGRVAAGRWPLRRTKLQLVGINW